MRDATSNHLTAVVAVGLVVGGIIAVRIANRPAQKPPVVEISPPPYRELEPQPSSSSVMHDAPAPPEGPFYASLFVAGKTWDLRCSWGSAIRSNGDHGPTSIQRCRVESVEVRATTASARIACWYPEQGKTPNPAVNTYVMTPAGLFEAADTPATDGEPLFRPHPIAKPLPARWGYDEPRGPTWAHAMIWHHGAWCTVDDFATEDNIGGYTQCISRHGIVGTSHSSMFMTESCGDVPE